MKNRKLLLIVSLVLALTMSLGGTLAYLTDTDDAVNVMTLGNVNIELLENGKTEGGFENWTHALYPAYYEGDYTANMDVTGAVAKVVNVENVGTSDAYIRVLFAFEMGGLTDEEFDKYIHLDWDENINPADIDWTTKINVKGEKYKVASYAYPKAVKAGEKAGDTLLRVVMDKEANNDIVGKLGESYEILVIAQAVQTANLDELFAKGEQTTTRTVAPTNKGAAYVLNETMGNVAEKAQAWFTEVYDKHGLPAAVASNAAALKAALTKGGNVVLTENVDVADAINLSNDVSIDLNGHDFNSNLMLNDGANVTIKNGDLVNTNDAVSAVQANTGATLTLENVEIASARHAVRVEGGTVTINGGTYKVVPTSNKTLHAVNVSDGGTVIINGGTFVGPKGTQADSGSAVNVQAGSVCIINGGNFSGGKPNTLSAKGTLKVYGGTFDQDPSQFVDTNKCEVKKVGDNWTVVKLPPVKVASTEDMKNALAEGKDVEVQAGTYTFPSSSITGDDTITCAPGTVFKGNSKLNIGGATVVGATFSNPSGTAADQTINGTFKDCVFDGSNGLRWCYAGETVVFENCVFTGDVYGVHFDGGANDVVFKNCTFSGFNAMGGAITKLTMEGCTFKANGRSGYNGINLWGSTDMIDCTFVFDGSVSYEWVDACGDNKVYNFTNCVVIEKGVEKGLEEFVGNYGTGNTITIK